MKVLYTSDLHGETHLYEELAEVAASSLAEIIALGGDLLPSFAPSKRYEDMIPHQRGFIGRFLLPFLKEIGEDLPGRRIFTIPGNWDLGYPFLFEQSLAGVIDLDRRAYRLENGFELMGYPFVPPTPFRPKEYEKMDDPDSPWPPQKSPSYIRSHNHPDRILAVDPHVYLRQRTSLQTDLSHMIRPLDFNRSVYIMHSPPFETRLDVIHGGRRAGSRSIRAFIEETQPCVTLHGHIHESPGLSGAYLDRIGKTISINPGQFTGTGSAISKLDAILFELESPAETLFHTKLPSGRSQKSNQLLDSSA